MLYTMKTLDSMKASKRFTFQRETLRTVAEIRRRPPLKSANCKQFGFQFVSEVISSMAEVTFIFIFQLWLKTWRQFQLLY